jgi:protein SCO1/2
VTDVLENTLACRPSFHCHGSWCRGARAFADRARSHISGGAGRSRQGGEGASVLQRPHRVFSDVLKGKIVLISFFFTDCKDACPLINARLSEIQSLLGDRLGRDILLISLTVDPERDRPPVLKSYAQRFGARSGWLFLTGEKANVDAITGRLGNVAPDLRGHATYLLLGNVDKARWVKVMPNAPEAAIAARLLALADDGAG